MHILQRDLITLDPITVLVALMLRFTDVYVDLFRGATASVMCCVMLMASPLHSESSSVMTRGSKGQV